MQTDGTEAPGAAGDTSGSLSSRLDLSLGGRLFLSTVVARRSRLFPGLRHLLCTEVEGAFQETPLWHPEHLQNPLTPPPVPRGGTNLTVTSVYIKVLVSHWFVPSAFLAVSTHHTHGPAAQQSVLQPHLQVRPGSSCGAHTPL